MHSLHEAVVQLKEWGYVFQWDEDCLPLQLNSGVLALFSCAELGMGVAAELFPGIGNEAFPSNANMLIVNPHLKSDSFRV